MLGRGTRKGEKYPDKSHFTVFDCFGGTLIERFKQATAITAEPPVGPSRTIAEIIEDIWTNRDRPYNTRCLAKRLQRIDKEMAARPATSSSPTSLTATWPPTPGRSPTKLHRDFTPP